MQESRNYVPILLIFTASIHFVDRQILDVLLEPIGQEFALSDSLLAYCQVSRLPIFIGLGPLFAGILSDLYIPHPGDESLRWSMISVLMVNVPGIVF